MLTVLTTQTVVLTQAVSPPSLTKGQNVLARECSSVEYCLSVTQKPLGSALAPLNKVVYIVVMS